MPAKVRILLPASLFAAARNIAVKDEESHSNSESTIKSKSPAKEKQKQSPLTLNILVFLLTVSSMISKTKIKKRLNKKTNPYIVKTIEAARKNNNWLKVAGTISNSNKKYSSVNLKEIDEQAKEGDTVLILGKVLGSGSLTKKVRVCALNFSESAKEKLKAHKCEVVTIIEEINKNPKAEGIKVIV